MTDKDDNLIMIDVNPTSQQNAEVSGFKDGKVLGPGPKDLVLGPGLQIFRSKFRTRGRLGPKKS